MTFTFLPPARSGSDVAWYLANYRPLERYVRAELWLLIRAATLAHVAAAAPRDSMEAKYIASPASQFIAFAYELGVDLEEPRQLFAKSLIDRWIATLGNLSIGSRSNYRSAVERVAAAVNPHWGDLRTVGLYRDTAAEPYTRSDLLKLDSVERWQVDGIRRSNVTILRGLGLGAGLLTKDVRDMVGDDVVEDASGVVINVRGRNPRSVPVRRRYEQVVLDAAKRAGSGYLVLPTSTARGNNMITAFFGDLRYGDAPRLSMLRMRVTWLVWHFDQGTPLQAIEAAAGARIETLTRYVRYCTPVAPHEARRRLRGDES